MMVAAVSWPDVALAAIPTFGTAVTAYIAYLVKRDVRTPSGKPIGAQVEDVNHTTRSSHHYAAAISKKVGANLSPEENGEAQKVDALKADDAAPGG